VADDYRQRCADAAMNAWYMNAVLCDHSQTIPFGNLVDAVLAVPHPELERLHKERAVMDRLNKVADDDWAQAVRDLRAEVKALGAAVARVRALHTPDQPPEGHQWVSGGRQPKCEGCDHEGNPFTAPDWPCDTIRALDGEEPDHG
jgi:hypothetical protein